MGNNIANYIFVPYEYGKYEMNTATLWDPRNLFSSVNPVGMNHGVAQCPCPNFDNKIDIWL